MPTSVILGFEIESEKDFFVRFLKTFTGFFVTFIGFLETLKMRSKFEFSNFNLDFLLPQK